MQEFNKEILDTMSNQVKQIKSVYEVCNYCKEGNRIANEEYLKSYPTHKDLLSIIESSVEVIEINIINEFNSYIVENALSTIEFIIGQNVLSESHIQRLLLGPKTILEFTIFKKKTETISNRFNEIYNCESNRFYYNYDEFKASLPFNYQQLESYMRYNKVGYEEELVGGEINGDYVYEHMNIDVDENIVNKINNAYPNLENINVIDRFKLEQHGLKPICEFNNQFIHYKNGKQYNLYKYKNNYYMINESMKSYKISITEKPVDIPIESLFNTGRK
jgi:hypothetical protein